MTSFRLPELVACTGVLALAAVSAVAEPPSTIQLYGVARDFLKDHPDFDVTPANGTGHYAGNIALDLGPGNRPTFLGNGFKVATQWRTSAGDPIAPHLYVAGSAPGTVKLVNAPTIENNAMLDTWDSSVGPYGGPNVGPAPTFASGAEMPVLTEPTGLPSLVDEWKRDGNGTTLLDYDIHCNKFEISNYHTVRVSGHVIVLAEELFKIQNHAELVLLAGATMEIYFKKDAVIENNVGVNVISGNPAALKIYNLGINDLVLKNNVGLYAEVVAPNGGLLIENNADMFGSYVGKSLHVKNSGGLHVDTTLGLVLDACGGVLNDSAGAPALTSSGDITSAASFDQWYTDVLGLNVSRYYPITLERNASGIYEYLDDAFYVLDGQGFGNEGEAHNNNFTFNIEATFTYDGCTGQFIELTSVDDGWVFIGDDLAIDLGGIEPGTEQVIELDRLNLTHGEAYEIRLFYAHRHGGTPVLHLRTNLELQDEPDQGTVSMSFD